MVRFSVTLPLGVRKRKGFSFLFDHAKGADPRLCRGVSTLLEERPSDTLGIHLFLPLVTVIAFVTRTRPFYVSLARFQISRLHVLFFQFISRGRFVPTEN